MTLLKFFKTQKIKQGYNGVQNKIRKCILYSTIIIGSENTCIELKTFLISRDMCRPHWIFRPKHAQNVTF